MAVTIDGTTGISAVQAGSIEADDLAPGVGGKVLQVVQTAKRSAYELSLSPFTTDTQNIPGLEATITPTSTSSKILISVYAQSGIGQNTNHQTLIYRNGSVVSDSLGTTGAGATTYGDPVLIGYLDSPNTTSSLTYGVRLRSPINSTQNMGIGLVDNGGASTVQDGSLLSTITLMEIAG